MTTRDDHHTDSSSPHVELAPTATDAEAPETERAASLDDVSSSEEGTTYVAPSLKTTVACSSPALPSCVIRCVSVTPAVTVVAVAHSTLVGGCGAHETPVSSAPGNPDWSRATAVVCAAADIGR